jgi:hypothetical protein
MVVISCHWFFLNSFDVISDHCGGIRSSAVHDGLEVDVDTHSAGLDEDENAGDDGAIGFEADQDVSAGDDYDEVLSSSYFVD